MAFDGYLKDDIKSYLMKKVKELESHS